MSINFQEISGAHGLFHTQYLHRYHYRISRTDYYRFDGDQVYGIERFNEIQPGMARIFAFNSQMVQQVPTLKQLSQQKILECLHSSRLNTASVYSPEYNEYDIYVRASSTKIDEDINSINNLSQLPVKERKELVNLRIYTDLSFKAYSMQLLSESLGFNFYFWEQFLYWAQFFINNIAPGDYNYYYIDRYFRLCIEHMGRWDHSDDYYVLCKRNDQTDNWVGLFHTNHNGLESWGELVQDSIDMNIRLNQLG